MIRPFSQWERVLNLKNIIRELRLMKSQPDHRFYAVLGVVILFILRHPVASLLAGLVAWHELR